MNINVSGNVKPDLGIHKLYVAELFLNTPHTIPLYFDESDILETCKKSIMLASDIATLETNNRDNDANVFLKAFIIVTS